MFNGTEPVEKGLPPLGHAPQYDPGRGAAPLARAPLTRLVFHVHTEIFEFYKIIMQNDQCGN